MLEGLRKLLKKINYDLDTYMVNNESENEKCLYIRQEKIIELLEYILDELEGLK